MLAPEAARESVVTTTVVTTAKCVVTGAQSNKSDTGELVMEVL